MNLKFLLKGLLLGTALFSFSAFSSGQTNYYFGGSGALTASVWSTNSGGPFSSLFVNGGIANFQIAGNMNGGSITVAGINATASVTLSSISGTISNLLNGIVTIDISSGVTLDFNTQSWTTSGTAGYIKNGGGVLAVGGNTYGGGFTLNDGTLVARGINAMGASGSLTINGGTISSNNNRDFTGKFTGITINNDFTLGASTGLSSNTANLTFSNIMALGSSVTRAITVGNAGTHILGGIISGLGSGLTVAAGSGTLTLTGANSYSGLTTVSSGILRLNRSGGTTIPSTNDIAINGGNLKVSTNQTISNLTLSSGTLTVDAGVTLTITGNYSATGGTINNLGTIKLNGGATSFPGSSVTVNNGTAGTMTNLDVATSGDVTLTGSFTVSGVLTFTSGKILMGSNDLSIGSAGSIATATSAKYVVTDGSGRLYFNAITTVAKVFPVGDATHYTPVTITNPSPGISDNYGVNVSTASAPPCLTVAPFSDDVVVATWDIAESTAGGSNCTIKIDYTSVVPGGTFDPTKAKIAHCSGSTVDYFSGSQVGTIVTGSGFTNFSPFGIASNTVLPIDLSRFEASLTNRIVNLNWNTATERNNAHFLIERSPDGLRFETIGKVTGAGATTVQHDYTFTDERPLKGLNFYRLKQVDFDGQFSYSSVVSVLFGQTIGLRLAPQPVLDQLQVSLDQATDQDGQWQVYDFSGRLLQSGTLEAESTEFRVPTGTLTQGAYMLRIMSGQSVLTQQFQKQ